MLDSVKIICLSEHCSAITPAHVNEISFDVELNVHWKFISITLHVSLYHIDHKVAMVCSNVDYSNIVDVKNRPKILYTQCRHTYRIHRCSKKAFYLQICVAFDPECDKDAQKSAR